MTIHLKNIRHLAKISFFLNKLPNIKYKINLSTKNIKKIYKYLFFAFDLFIEIYKISNKKISEKKKINLLINIRDLNNKYIFTHNDAVIIFKKINKIKSHNNQKGGSMYFLSDLEDKYKSSIAFPLEIISMTNSSISYVCSMIISTLGFPPFSIPPVSAVFIIPKNLLRLTKYLLILQNLLINVSRQDWSIVIKNGLSFFPQFLITQNQLETQLININKILKMANDTFSKIDEIEHEASDMMREMHNKKMLLKKGLEKYSK
jgi:hypothetical protein